MKYERLTERAGNGQARLKMCKICPDYCYNCEPTDEAIDRLAELEDKIEQGKMIELPCKVGDTVYRITQAYRDWAKVTAYIVKEIIIDKKGVSYLTLALKGAASIVSKVKFKNVFLTREEAEAKLKELQNDYGNM